VVLVDLPSTLLLLAPLTAVHAADLILKDIPLAAIIVSKDAPARARDAAVKTAI